MSLQVNFTNEFVADRPLNRIYNSSNFDSAFISICTDFVCVFLA